MPILILLACVGLLAGVGISAIGPGGVLSTIGLFLFTDLEPATISGTAMVTQLLAGTLGALAFTRSGHLQEPSTLRTAIILLTTALLGTPLGVLFNSFLSVRMFGILLAGFVTLAAVLVWLRHRKTVEESDSTKQPSQMALITLGFAIAIASGMFGVGGPLLTVPVFVALGMPLLPVLAAAQLQSIAIAAVGSIAYITIDAVDWWLALIVGIPQALGVLIGWKVARTVPAKYLRSAMIIILLAIAPFLAFR
ncbi:MAG: sulfite exporter TauE/SafE family protein [Microbacteriaceae bacterium]